MAQNNADLARELTNSFARWDKVYQQGCSDPFWADGVNLNLIRNHIIYFKKEIENKYLKKHYPKIYYQETPPKVPDDFMARTDEIRKTAQKTLQTYKTDPNYNYLLQRVDLLRPEVIDRYNVRNVLGYVQKLESAIEKDDLVGMRRCQNTKNEVFAQCANKIKEMGSPTGQLSIFDAIATAQDELAHKQKTETRNQQTLDVKMSKVK